MDTHEQFEQQMRELYGLAARLLTDAIGTGFTPAEPDWAPL